MALKPITVKFDEDLYEKISNHPLSNSEIIRKSCIMFLENGKAGHESRMVLQSNTNGNTNSNTGITHGENEISDQAYSQLYNELYNIEVLPLKTEVDHLNDILNLLKEDKKYLQEQNNALILAKHPILTRLKLALLPSKFDK